MSCGPTPPRRWQQCARSAWTRCWSPATTNTGTPAAPGTAAGSNDTPHPAPVGPGWTSKSKEEEHLSDQSAAPTARRGLLPLLTAAAFMIFAQAFMIAPILPQLEKAFHITPGVVGLAVPAYLIPYGAMTLVWGPLSDRIGRRPVIIASLAASGTRPASPRCQRARGGR